MDQEITWLLQRLARGHGLGVDIVIPPEVQLPANWDASLQHRMVVVPPMPISLGRGRGRGQMYNISGRQSGPALNRRQAANDSADDYVQTRILLQQRQQQQEQLFEQWRKRTAGRLTTSSSESATSTVVTAAAAAG